MIDRVVRKLGRELREVPVGFKWFVSGLVDGSCCFGGEESAGASFLRRDGSVWTTDKDGPIMDLLAAEITARTGKDPGEHYRELTAEFGTPYYTRIDAPATPEQKAQLLKLSPTLSRNRSWQAIESRQVDEGSRKPGCDWRVESRRRKRLVRSPSFGTENIYKIYAESFKSESHLNAIVNEAQQMVNNALGSECNDERNGASGSLTGKVPANVRHFRRSTVLPDCYCMSRLCRRLMYRRSRTSAYSWVDRLHDAGQSWWQALPSVRLATEILRIRRCRRSRGNAMLISPAT